MNFKHNLVFMGTSEFAVPALKALINNDIVPDAVYTQPDRVGGRGRKIIMSPIKKIAQELDLNILQPETLKDTIVFEEFKQIKPDVLVLAAYGNILPEEYLAVPKGGGLNIHPSLLPLHRGPSPVVHTILEGDLVAGVSIFIMDKGMDSGSVIASKTFSLNGSETGGELTNTLSVEGASLLIPTLKSWMSGITIPVPQIGDKATYSKLLKKSDSRLDFNESADKLRRQILAFNPWPAAYTTYKGKRLVIRRADIIESTDISLIPGQVTYIESSQKLLIGTNDNLLLITELQLEGKKPMVAADFIRGYRDLVGQELPN